MDPWVHLRAIHHYQCVAVCSLFVTQLHVRQFRQLNLIYLQNCYILHRRGMATARASRQAQATHQERIVPAQPVPNPAPSPTVEVAVFSVEPGEENTTATPKTPPYKPATKKNNISDLSLPARCPAVTWSDDQLDDVSLDDVPPTTQFPDEGDEGDTDHDHDAKTQDWPDTNSDPDQNWHPKGPYDPAYDIDSPLWDSELWYAARAKEDLELGIPDFLSATPRDYTNDPRFTRRDDHFFGTHADFTKEYTDAEDFDYTNDHPNSDTKDFDTKDDYDADSSEDDDYDSAHDTKDDGEPDSPPLSPLSADRRQTSRLRRMYEKLQDKRSAPNLLPLVCHSREFLEDWAAKRARCNGTDYSYDFPDYHFHSDYATDYNSDLQSPSLTDEDEAREAYYAELHS